jgi:hypothetical protein
VVIVIVINMDIDTAMGTGRNTGMYIDMDTWTRPSALARMDSDMDTAISIDMYKGRA